MNTRTELTEPPHLASFSLSTIRLLAGLSLGLLASTLSSKAQTVVLDQIGDGSQLGAGFAYASQIFEPSFSAFNVAVIDDFTLSGAFEITKIEAVIMGFNSPNSPFASITGYSVNIYSSVAAAQSSLTGDIGSLLVAPGSVTLNSPFISSSYPSALISIPVDFMISSAGLYYVGVSPVLDYTNHGQVGVNGINQFSWGTPGGQNAYQVNPPGGFMSAPTALALDAAYRVSGTPNTPVPEPSTYGLMAAAGLAGFAALRRRKRA